MRTLLLAFTSAVVYAESSPPMLNMVIFNQSPPPESTVKPLAVNNTASEAPMQMVIFNEETPAQNQPAISQTAEETPAEAAPASKDNLTVQYYVDGGYRRDDLNWTIADPSGTPNILSELQWKKVETAMLTTGINITYADSWEMEGKLGYGKVVNGRNQDSDYVFNDRQGEFSRSYSVTDDGATLDLSGSLGYHITLGSKNFTPRLRLTPKIGYAFHSQQFNDTHGVQVISDSTLVPGTPPVGNFNGVLNSTYDGTWYGPWGGMSAHLLLSKKLALQGSVAYHLVDYEGTGNWNLRSDFAHPTSFKHSAEGYGIVASANARYLVTPEWGVRLSADYQNFKANRKGFDTTYFSDGSASDTGLNQVNWNSYGFNLGVEYRF
jgi:hypothetical protein